MAYVVLSWPAAIHCIASTACLQDGFLISLCQVPDRKVYNFALFGLYMHTYKLPLFALVWNPKVIRLMQEKNYS